MASNVPANDDIYDKALRSILEGLKSLGITKLSKKQRQALLHFSKGYDTMAILPTGHGKSLIYQMAVLLAEEMKMKYISQIGESDVSQFIPREKSRVV